MLPFLHLQYDQMSMQASQYGDKLRAVKAEVLEVNRLIGRLQSEMEAVKSQVARQQQKVRKVPGPRKADSRSLSAWQSGKPVNRGGGPRRARHQRGQSPCQGPRGGSAEGQTRHGQAAPRVPGGQGRTKSWEGAGKEQKHEESASY